MKKYIRVNPDWEDIFDEDYGGRGFLLSKVNIPDGFSLVKVIYDQNEDRFILELERDN